MKLKILRSIVFGGAFMAISASTLQAIHTYIVVGADAGGGPHVKSFDEFIDEERSFFAFEESFQGGVTVAYGDVTGDGVPDIVVGAGAGGGPQVRVFDGRTGVQVSGPVGSFLAFVPGFRGGVFVATADIDGDGFADIICGAGPGGGPHVRVISGRTGAELRSFFAYVPGFAGGVRVAASDINGDGTQDIITGAGPGGGPHVRVFSGSTGAQLPGNGGSFFAFDPGFTGGVTVAGGNVNGDGLSNIIVGAGAGGGPQVRVFHNDATQIEGPFGSFFAFDPGFTGEARVGVADIFEDGNPLILVAAGPGAPSHVRLFDVIDGSLHDEFFPFVPGFSGGVWPGGRNGEFQRLPNQ